MAGTEYTTVSLVGYALLLIAIYYAYKVVAWYRGILLIGRQINKLPHDKPHWLFGNLRQHPGPNETGLMYSIDMMTRLGGRVNGFFFGPFRPCATFGHPDTLKLILKTTEPKATRGNGPYGMIKPWIGEGLLVAGGAKWQRNRKLLTPAFHFDILKPYMQVNNEAVDILLEKWNKLVEAKPGESIEISKSISLCTLEIIMKCALSYNSDVQAGEEDNKYVNSILSLGWLISDRGFKLLMYIDWIYHRSANGRKFARDCDYVHKLAEEIIERRKQALKEQKVEDTAGRRRDFLDIILLARDENGLGLTDLEIRNEVDTFLFEGHDTTASAMTWFLYNLARHPEIQERVYEEVNALIAGRDSPYITWADVVGGNELQYLTMCLKESLRLHPPVPFVVRDLTTPLEVDGVTLLPGTIIDVGIWHVHHNRFVWGDDHMEYKPERFSPENVKTIEPHAFIPFSAGPRNCIGQVFAMHELKSLTARIIHRFKLEADPSHKVEISPELVLRAKNGIKLKMIPRI